MINLNAIFADSTQKTAEMQSKESINVTEPVENKIENSIEEQKNIIKSNEYELSEEDFSFESSFVQSVEEDGDPDSFEEAADDSGGDDDFGDDDFGDEGGDDSFGDDIGGSDDGGGDDSQTGGGNGSAGGVDDLDLNTGSSLNTFTQINQKIYIIDSLNKLLNSIQDTINRYNDIYTDWSELNQLKSLAEIVDEERNSFMMQENPENLIKLRLYQEQYAKIVNRLSVLIKQKAKNKKD